MEKKNACDRSESVRPSFREAFCRAAKQVELACAEPWEQNRLRELCYIIAVVYLIDPDSKIKIDDEILDAYVVQEIFSELTLDHLRLVLDNFKRVKNIIHNKKAYFRTALYNSVFELESHYANLVNHDLANR